MFKEPYHLLHPTDLVLSKARLYPSLLEDGEKFPCVLVLPGGGYGGVSHQEGPPVAGWFNSMGISAVVLEYTVSDGAAIYPEPQQQAVYALRWLRQNADKLNIDPDKIGVIGFSAGGHLAACVSHGFDRKEWLLDPDQTLAGISARPDASLLCYSVLTSEHAFAHTGSFKNLLGDLYMNSIKETVCWPKNVHANAPHTFLWHTAADNSVPVENAYMMAIGLQAQKIPHELHVFPNGNHGIGLGTIGTRRQGSADQWRTLAERWLRELGF